MECAVTLQSLRQEFVPNEVKDVNKIKKWIKCSGFESQNLKINGSVPQSLQSHLQVPNEPAWQWLLNIPLPVGSRSRIKWERNQFTGVNDSFTSVKQTSQGTAAFIPKSYHSVAQIILFRKIKPPSCFAYGNKRITLPIYLISVLSPCTGTKSNRCPKLELRLIEQRPVWMKAWGTFCLGLFSAFDDQKNEMELGVPYSDQFLCHPESITVQLWVLL